MYNFKQYREKAAEYSVRAETANGESESREFDRRARSFNSLADNEQWLSDNHDKTVKTSGTDSPDGHTLAAQEKNVLICLGAALVMQWNTVPAKLRRELFDNAGTMGELLHTTELRGQIARFLHKHDDGELPLLSL
jgi:hypothetical protein